MTDRGQTDHHLVDYPALQMHRLRSQAQGNPCTWVHEQAAEEVKVRLGEMSRRFADVAVVTGHADFWSRAFPSASVHSDADILDLTPQGVDLVLHAMCLHWANDPVGQLIQCRRGLRSDGLLLAVCFGDRTLVELRSAMANAELEVSGGISPRVLPMADVRQYGDLMQRAGLGQPVADRLSFRRDYRSTLELMLELRAMGETNALQGRLRRFTRRGLMMMLENSYTMIAGGEDGSLRATFELVFMTGWASEAGGY